MFKKIAILVLLALIIAFTGNLQTRQSSAAFSDVGENNSFKQAIDFAESEGIIGGYADGSFRPSRILNRAEFVKILVESRFSSGEINACVGSPEFYKKRVFPDIQPGVWYEKYACLAKKKGIIQGYSDGTFRGTQPIIFAEAAKITVESYGFEVSSGDPWFKPYLEKLAKIDAVPASISAIPNFIDRGVKKLSRGEMTETIFLLREEDDEVASIDKDFTMKIPEIALPEGLEKEDISITRLSSSENPVEEVNGAPMIFYRLEPNNIKFRKPVDFQIKARTIGNAIPLIFIVSGEDFDMLPNPIIEIDQSKKTAILSGKLEHFSSLVLSSVPGTTVDMSTLENHYIADKSFLPRLTVVGTIDDNTYFLPDYPGQSISIIQPLIFRNGMFVDKSESLDPPSITLDDFSIAATETHTIESSESFTCNTTNSNVSILYSTMVEVHFDRVENGVLIPNQVGNVTMLLPTNFFQCSSRGVEQEGITVEGSGPNPLNCPNVGLGNSRIYVIQLDPEEGSECVAEDKLEVSTIGCNGEEHYQAVDNAAEIITESGLVVSNPDPEGCGFGEKSKLERGILLVK